MKKLILAAVLLSASLHANAFWGGNNNFMSGNGWGNDWPVWTPMYWMEEMSGNNGFNNNRYANPWGGNPNMSTMPWNQNPWSNQPNINGQFPANNYSPYFGGGPNAGYPQGYPQGYTPLPGYQNIPLAPSSGPTVIRP